MVPRHPPCALTILTVIGPSLRCSVRSNRDGPVIPVFVATVQFSRTGERLLRRNWRRSLKTQQHGPRLVVGVSAAAAAGPLLVLASARSGSVDVPGPACGPSLSDGLREAGGRRALRRGTVSVLPRKEVIQPQLPLRLPCYDFTPVTGPTFDGSLPCGLGHRLRVLLASVV